MIVLTPILFVVFSWFVVVVVHEYGHWATGTFLGYRSRFVRWGTAVAHYHHKEIPPRHLILILAAGPFANLLMGGMIMAGWIPTPGTIPGAWIGIYVIVFGLWNLFPYKEGNRSSDGLQILTAIRSRKESNAS